MPEPELGLFRLLVESVRDYAIFALDPHGRIMTWTNGAEHLKGYRAEEIIGRHFSVFYPDEDVARGKPAQELRMATTFGRYAEEGWRIRKDGTRFWASVVITTLRDPHTGEVVGFGKVTRDLTDRLLYEQALRESEERFRLLVEGVTDYAIFLLDAEGRVQSWNTGAQRLIGYRPAEIVGDHISRFYLREEAAAGRPQRELEIAGREGRYEEEGWRVRKDGTKFWANVIVTSLRDPETGRLLGFSKVTRDLTERKRADDVLRQSFRDMESFSYTVSHDLRAPLRAIHTVADITLHDTQKLDPEIQHNLASIRESAERASHLVEDLLEFAKVSRGDLRWDAVSIAELARDTAKELSERDPRKVDLCIEEPETLSVHGDPALLRLVLGNLLGNAWKYTKKTAHPKVVMGPAHATEEDRVAFYVRDNGVGFDPAKARDLFEPFRRLHNDVEFQGTGVGLATVRRIVERHGGCVRAESKPGEGATFVVELPFDKPPRS
ncbi:MAG TPA: PAS domain S-box protein [Candidatus Thermoplasmatota archaeon]|nr:PAS domain S-box protein [Candidatus Thermoplasmatota archaeon]